MSKLLEQRFRAFRLVENNQIRRTETHIFGALGTILFFLICILPGLYFSLQSIQTPWTKFQLARAVLSLESGHINEFVVAATAYRGEHIGTQFLYTGLADTTNWPIGALALVPIGSLLLAVLYYAISWQISGSRWTTMAITLFASWYYPRLISQFAVQTYVWTNILFLTFLLVLLFWLRERTVFLSLLLFLIFIGTFLHYHTTPIWIIAILFTIIGALKMKRAGKILSRPSPSWAMVIFCIVLYLAFDTVFYGNGLVRLTSELVSESFIHSVAGKIIAPLLARSPTELEPYEITLSNPRIAVWSNLIVFLLLIVPPTIWAMVKIYKANKLADIRILVSRQSDPFVWAIIIAAITHALIYTAYGAVSLRVIPLAFPLLLPIVLGDLRLKTLHKRLLISILPVAAVVGFISYATSLNPGIDGAETGLIDKLVGEGKKVLSSADVYGSLLINSAQDSRLVDLVWLNSDNYGAAVGQGTIDPEEFDYLVIDKSNRPLISYNWQYFEPWTEHIPEINKNDRLSKIYDNGKFAIFQANEAGWPLYEPDKEEIQGTRRSIITDMLGLTASSLMLLTIPGLAVVSIAIHRRSIKLRDFPSFIGLGIGFSVVIVTFTGYLVNFTSLGLGWLVPLLIIFPGLIVAIYLLIQRPKFRIKGTWAISASVLVLVLFAWTLLSASVAYYRIQEHSEFVEFFVSGVEQKDQDARRLVVNVINRFNQSAEFSVDVEISETEIESLGKQDLLPSGIWSTSWPISSRSEGERLIFRLYRNGILDKELWISSNDKLADIEINNTRFLK